MKKLSELVPGEQFRLGEALLMVLQSLDFISCSDKGIWVAVIEPGMYYEAGQTWYMLPELEVEERYV